MQCLWKANDGAWGTLRDGSGSFFYCSAHSAIALKVGLAPDARSEQPGAAKLELRHALAVMEELLPAPRLCGDRRTSAQAVPKVGVAQVVHLHHLSINLNKSETIRNKYGGGGAKGWRLSTGRKKSSLACDDEKTPDVATLARGSAS